MAQTPSMGGYAPTEPTRSPRDKTIEQWFVSRIAELRASGQSTAPVEEQLRIFRENLKKNAARDPLLAPPTSPGQTAARFGAAHLARRRATAGAPGSIGRPTVPGGPIGGPRGAPTVPPAGAPLFQIPGVPYKPPRKGPVF